jgi:alkanesulfonate monooxygenase SsuD/methylene tetrahydromethanopterin reductase-like flavin-dependent oxidoreductase (luciferase family)
MVRELTLVGSPERLREGLEAYWRSGLETPGLAISSVLPDAASRRAELDRVIAELAPGV